MQMKKYPTRKVVSKDALTTEVELWVTSEAARTVLCLSGLEDRKRVVVVHCHTPVR